LRVRSRAKTECQQEHQAAARERIVVERRFPSNHGRLHRHDAAMPNNELLVSDARVMARPDEAVTFTANGATRDVLLLIAGKVMVWLSSAAADGMPRCMSAFA
jgi:hypothetical protein